VAREEGLNVPLEGVRGVGRLVLRQRSEAPRRPCRNAIGALRAAPTNPAS
jgi:hypothetical protein